MDLHRHISIEKPGEPRQYKHVSIGGGGDKHVVASRPDRVGHGTRLTAAIGGAGEAIQNAADKAGHDIKDVALEIAGNPKDLQLESLDRIPARVGAELRSVVERDGKHYANVFVPESQLKNFVRIFERYTTQDDERSGKAKNHDLVSGIDEIRTPVLKSFWTDDPALFPTSETTPIWWEVWLQARKSDEPDAAFTEFVATVTESNLRVGSHLLKFPERLVFHVHGTTKEWTRVFVPLLDRLAELRKAKEIASEFFRLDGQSQAELIDDLVARITPPSESSPSVCVLDYGVTNEHKLLSPFLDAEDRHVLFPDWSFVDPEVHHGSEVAGLALFGLELPSLLGSEHRPFVPHRIESVRILNHAKAHPEETWGWVTQEGVALAEQGAPERARVVLLPVTTDNEGRDRGIPTSWSAAIDQSAAGELDETRRLYVVSAGNIWTATTDEEFVYPDHNLERHTIEDPAQAWNALTVGACTELIQIRDPEYDGYLPLAKQGELCPTSRTSVAWDDNELPLKPDIVLEGGNLAKAPDGSYHGLDDLTLLTTSGNVLTRPLVWMGDTSAAAAQAARMAAILQSDYPELWPEMIRGLLVHSARWTPAMENQVRGARKADLERRLRCFGYGTPDLDRARFTLNNRVALVHQGTIQPFELEGGGAQNKDYHFHALPWPRQALADLHENPVRMRVTLSYFIEPNPTRRGWTGKFRYQSHGLRFKLRGPTELEENFKRRVSAAEQWDKDSQGSPDVSDPINWTIGSNRQTKGSIHSDWWATTGSELSACGDIAIHPVTGWWKERPHLERVNSQTRYALIVTLETDGEDTDLYTPIMNEIAASTQIDT